MNFTTERTFIFSTPIYEIDMVSAGLSVIKAKKMLIPRDVAYIESLPKSEQSIYIGQLSKDNPNLNLSKRITEGIEESVKSLIVLNDYVNDDIVSIKRDAVFVAGRQPAVLKLENGLTFKIKNTYSSFIRLDNIELYSVSSKRLIHVKGINDEKIPRHSSMLDFIIDIIHLLNKRDKVVAANTMQLFREDYINRQLPKPFYREFNNDSSFRIIIGSSHFLVGQDDADDIDLQIIDTSYNLKNVLIPLCSIISNSP